jgi:AcrR family transcriptional regulator
MAAVSKRAGVSIGAIYGRFEGKSGLLRAVKDRALHQLEAELADRYEAPQVSGSADDLQAPHGGLHAATIDGSCCRSRKVALPDPARDSRLAASRRTSALGRPGPRG